MSRTYRHAPIWAIKRYEERYKEYRQDLELANFNRPTRFYWDRAIKNFRGRRPVLRDGFLKMRRAPHGWCRPCGTMPKKQERYENRQLRHRAREEIRKGEFDRL